MGDPNVTRPENLRTQLRIFAEGLHSIHEMIESGFYELEQKLISHKNLDRLNENHRFVPSKESQEKR